jgi:PIN domain nuclease of toxin-antitoxin system
MKILLDTHAMLWCFSDPDSLSQKATEAFLDSGNNLFLSAASYWEICLKISTGKLSLDRHWEKTIDRELSRNGIQWLNLEKPHFIGVINLPRVHRDPFDRILVAQAVCEHMTIMTSDENIRQYKVKTIW